MDRLARNWRVYEVREQPDYQIQRDQMAKLNGWLALSLAGRELKREQVRQRIESERVAMKYRLPGVKDHGSL